jgi:plasmid stabilization system protein ParE
MRLPLIIRPTAQAELAEAAAWYDGQRPGLGSDLVDAVQQVLDTIANQPKRYPVATRNIREAPVSRFPYCIYYRLKQDRVVVIAVYHTSRDPSGWQGRN